MKKIKIFKWQAIAFLMCVLAFGSSAYRDGNDDVNRQFYGQSKSDWGAANVWIASAECARETGAWLSICEGNKLYPIAQYALADDPGHAFLLGIIARLKDRSISVSDIAKLNNIINLVGLVFIVAILVSAQLEVASLVVLMLSPVTYFGWVGASPHPGLIGVATMASIFPLTILLGELGYLTKISKFIFLISGAVLLGLAAMLREPIGTMGLVVSLGAFAYIGLNKRWSANVIRRRLWILLLLGVALVMWQTPRWVLMARDSIFQLQPTSLIQTHGISHNLYIGLGAAGKNKFGISWNDSSGDEAVRAVDPKVRYVSKEYFDILWRLYLDRVAQDPREVIRIYTFKLRRILEYRFPKWGPPLVVTIIGSCALLAAFLRRRRVNDCNEFGAESIVLVTALAFIAMFIAQGVLAHPARQYAHPIGAFVLLIFSVGFQFFVQLRFRENRALL